MNITISHLNILYVEDEEYIAKKTAQMIGRFFNTVIHCSNGEEAIEFLQKNIQNINIVITDIVMPKVDGIALIKHIKHNFGDSLPVIALTAYYNENGAELDNLEVLSVRKPLIVADLFNAVEKIQLGKK